ncbi:YgaP family membrane protein [Salsuginibacillus kocurii]|uniref:YgaP family membrane protein n=1 Tax=Salsuginibacillus kocurii TaxID=427078 RepID=UPI000367704D|nr:DUF2892 domain-containing protein [Salsuginibacillus kocurii]
MQEERRFTKPLLTKVLAPAIGVVVLVFMAQTGLPFWVIALIGLMILFTLLANFRSKLHCFEESFFHQKTFTGQEINYEEIASVETKRRVKRQGKNNSRRVTYSFHFKNIHNDELAKVEATQFGRKETSEFLQLVAEKNPEVQFDETAEEFKNTAKLPWRHALFG